MTTAVKVQSEARRLCPVDTGTLRRSISFAIEGSGTTAKARVGSNVEYARAVEEETGIYGIHHRPIVPVRAKVLKFNVRGKGLIFAQSVKGSPGRHYLRNALKSVGL